MTRKHFGHAYILSTGLALGALFFGGALAVTALLQSSWELPASTDGAGGGLADGTGDTDLSETALYSSVPVDFRQAANNDAPYPLGNLHWINSALQGSNSVYAEGMSVPQRLMFWDIPATAGDEHVLVFSHQWTKGGTHAYDWLTSFEPQALAVDGVFLTVYAQSPVTIQPNPCGDEIGPPGDLDLICEAVRSSGYMVVVDVPDDGYVSKDGVTQDKINEYEDAYGNRTITIYGDAPIAAAALMLDHSLGYEADAEDSHVIYELSWASASTTIVVEMAGHLAVGASSSLSPAGWGAGLGASSISGGPYHFKLLTLDGASLGSQDNQIQGSAISPPPIMCEIDDVTLTCDPNTPGLDDVSGAYVTYEDWNGGPTIILTP